MAVELDWPNWPGFSDKAMADMDRYRWPGNVRELRNVVERAVYRWEDPERPVDSIQFDPFSSPWAPTKTAASAAAPEPAEAAVETPADEPAPPIALETDDFRGAVDSYERALLEDALKRNRFNQRATASAIGLSYDQLRHALKRHKLLDAGSR
jgi:psp operon transcriptional activator